MAKMTDLTVDVGVVVSDQTAKRCLRILEMWQEDNPDKFIEGEWIHTDTREVIKFRIRKRKLNEEVTNNES